MESLSVTFPVSGVQTCLFLPPLVAFIISFATSMAGVSGAFMLLPFQVSILGYTAPSVSATNQVFNVVAIPSGVWRYVREKRMVWPLTWAVVIGTLPGVVIGAWLRVAYLPDPRNFKLFAGMFLLYIGLRLFLDVIRPKPDQLGPASAPSRTQTDGQFTVTHTRFSMRQVEFTFAGQPFAFPPAGAFLVCFLVGIAGGIYGVGGGSIIAPFLVVFFGLPVYVVAGAALMGTFVTSVAGVLSYHLLAWLHPSMSVAPDWALGALFGLGGLGGMYLGARCQKHVPARLIKAILCACVLGVAIQYVVSFF